MSRITQVSLANRVTVFFLFVATVLAGISAYINLPRESFPDVEIPLVRLTVISGISGSGKSSLMRGVIAPGVESVVSRKRAAKAKFYKSMTGAKEIQAIARALGAASVSEISVDVPPTSEPIPFSVG